MALLKGSLLISSDAAMEQLVTLLQEAQRECVTLGIDVRLVEHLGPRAACVLHEAAIQANLAGLMKGQTRQQVFRAPPMAGLALPPKPSSNSCSSLLRKDEAAAALPSRPTLEGDKAGKGFPRPESAASSSSSSLAMHKPSSSLTAQTLVVPTATTAAPPELPAGNSRLQTTTTAGGRQQQSAAAASRPTSRSMLRSLHAIVAPDEAFLLSCGGPAVGPSVLYDASKLRLASRHNPWLA
jgi:hypothetical protein